MKIEPIFISLHPDDGLVECPECGGPVLSSRRAQTAKGEFLIIRCKGEVAHSTCLEIVNLPLLEFYDTN